MLRVPSRGQTGRQGAPGDATRSAQRTAPGVGNAEPFLAGSDSRLRRRSLPPHDQDKALRQDGPWQPEMLRRLAADALRSEERRVGKAGVRTCSTRVVTVQKKK